MDNKFEAIVCIVNSGFSETVMDAARKCGATGGTVFSARGTANPDGEKFFGISIEPEKEIVLVVVEKAIRDKILEELYKTVGLSTPGQGIAFALPVDDIVGISDEKNIPHNGNDGK